MIMRSFKLQFTNPLYKLLFKNKLDIYLTLRTLNFMICRVFSTLTHRLIFFRGKIFYLPNPKIPDVSIRWSQ